LKLDDIISDVAEYGLSDNCVLEYFGTLYEVASNFHCTGEMILQHNGFRSRVWVESLFELAANSGCLEGLPFEAIQPLITQEIVAHFCLANDILETAFYEYSLFKQYQELQSLPPAKLTNQTLKELRIARRKFCSQKMEYLNLAYGLKLASKSKCTYDVCTVYKRDAMQQNILLALELMPIVYQAYPRNENTADMAPVRKLCRKYIRLFTICTEFRNE